MVHVMRIDEMECLCERWEMAREIGYKPKTTFWDYFTVAERYGVGGVNDTFRRAFDEWKDDYVYLTELVLVLNHKIWQWHGKNNALAGVYGKLWKEADGYAVDNLKGNELDYFYATTD